MRCITEATAASALVLYCRPGETLKGALIEVGAALAACVPIYCVGECEGISSVFRKHPLWNDCPDIEAAFDAALNVATITVVRG